MLRVIPQSSHRIPVEIPQYQPLVLSPGVLSSAECALARANARWEGIHQTLVKRLLLVAIGVILVAGRCLRAIEAERVDRVRAVRRIVGIGVIGQQDPLGSSVDQGPQSID